MVNGAGRNALVPPSSGEVLHIAYLPCVEKVSVFVCCLSVRILNLVTLRSEMVPDAPYIYFKVPEMMDTPPIKSDK